MPPNVPRISALAALAKTKAGYVYVDVRTVEEYAEAHPAGALNVPWLVRGASGLEPNPDFVPLMQRLFQKDAKLVLGCRTGHRSLHAAENLMELGYTDVLDQRAGMAGARGPFGETTEHGWVALRLPTQSGAPEGRSYADLLKIEIAAATP